MADAVEEKRLLDEARAALKEIHSGKAWNAWLALGRAFVFGRDEAMNAVGATRPNGAVYNGAFGDWLQKNGLNSVDGTTRHALFCCMESQEAIEEWRESLTPDDRAKWNHPCTVLNHWRNRSEPGAAEARRKNTETLRDVNLRLTDENDRLKRRVFDSPEEEGAVLFVSNGAEKCRQLAEVLLRKAQEEEAWP